MKCIAHCTCILRREQLVHARMVAEDSIGMLLSLKIFQTINTRRIGLLETQFKRQRATNTPRRNLSRASLCLGESGLSPFEWPSRARSPAFPRVRYWD